MEFPQKSQWLSIKILCIWCLSYLYFYLPLCMKAPSSRRGLFPTPWALHGTSGSASLFTLSHCLEWLESSKYNSSDPLRPFSNPTSSCEDFPAHFSFETFKYFLFFCFPSLVSCQCALSSHLDWAPGLYMHLLFLYIFSS